MEDNYSEPAGENVSPKANGASDIFNKTIPTIAIILSIIAISLSVFSTVGNTPPVDVPTTTIVDHGAKIEELSKQLDEQGERILSLSFADKAAFLDTSNLGKYSIMQNAAGDFPVILENVTPYLDGHKISLKVGNMSSAVFNGFSLEAAYSKEIFPFEPEGSKETSYTQDLSPGSWTTVDMIFTPVKSDEFKHIRLNIETDSISLKN